jgi:hypothetical protein
MFQRIVVLDDAEERAHAIPLTRDVEVTEKDLADAVSYLAALQNAYARKTKRSPAYPIDESPDSLKEAMMYCQTNFFC